jgi:hypothetical protein
VTGLRLDLHRAKIDGFFTRRVRESTVRKSGNSGKNQNDSNDFHRASGYKTIGSMERVGFGAEAIDLEPRKIRSGLDRAGWVNTKRFGLLSFVPDNPPADHKAWSLVRPPGFAF